MLSNKPNKFLVTWQETEHHLDPYENNSNGYNSRYPVTIEKFAMVSDVNDLQNYVTKKAVKFYALGEELNVKLNTTVEVKVTSTVRR